MDIRVCAKDHFSSFASVKLACSVAGKVVNVCLWTRPYLFEIRSDKMPTLIGIGALIEKWSGPLVGDKRQMSLEK